MKTTEIISIVRAGSMDKPERKGLGKSIHGIAAFESGGVYVEAHVYVDFRIIERPEAPTHDHPGDGGRDVVKLIVANRLYVDVSGEPLALTDTKRTRICLAIEEQLKSEYDEN